MARRTSTVKLSIRSSYDDRGTRDAERALEQFEKKVNTAGSAQATALARSSVALDQSAAKWRSTGDTIQRVGRGMTSVGDSLTVGLTLPIVAAGAAMTKTAIDFESAFAGVEKTVDATEEQFNELEQGIRDMALQLPATREEIAGVAAAAGQLGIETGSILDFTRVMIDLGESTNMSAIDGATALARLANITQMSQDEFSNLGSSVVALGNSMATTESEIVDMGLRIAGAGTQIGMTESDIMALAAALSSVGIESEAGGTAISKTMIEIESAVQSGGAQLELWAEAAQMSAADFAAAWSDDPSSALNSVITGLGKMDAQGGSTLQMLEDLGITSIRQRDVLLRAAGAGDALTDALKTSADAWTDNSALSEEAAKRYETTEAQMAILRNKVSDVALEFGKSLVPALVDAIDAAQPVLDWAKKMAEKFSELEEDEQKQVIQFVAIAAALGPVLSITGRLTTAVGGAVKAYGFLQGALATYQAKQAAATAATAASNTALGATAGLSMGAQAGLLGMAAVAGYAIGNLLIKVLGLEDELESLGKTIGESEWYMDALGVEMAQTAELTAEQIELDKKLGLERDENNTLTADSIATLREYNDKQRSSTGAANDSTRAIGNLTSATEAAAEADDAATEAKEALVRAMDGQKVAADSLEGKERAAAEAVNDAEQAAIAAREAQDHYNEVLKEHPKDSDEAKKAALRLEDANWRAKDAAVDAADAQAAFNTAVSNAKPPEQATLTQLLEFYRAVGDAASVARIEAEKAARAMGRGSSGTTAGRRTIREYGTGGYVSSPEIALVGDEPEYIINPKAPNAPDLLARLVADMDLRGGTAQYASVRTMSSRSVTVAPGAVQISVSGSSASPTSIAAEVERALQRVVRSSQLMGA